MKRASWLKNAVAAGSEFHAMKVDPAVHNRINLAAAAGVIGLYAATIAWGALGPPAWLYVPVASVFFGSLVFGVFILIVHECSHNMFLVFADREKQKRWNHWIGVVAAGAFFTDYTRHWEKGHTVHHLRPCEDDDPQDRDPITGAALYKQYLLLLLAPGYVMAINPSNQYGFNPKRLLGGLLYWAPLVLLTGFLIGWMVPLALYGGMVFTMVLNMTKKAQEHGDGLKEEPDALLRSRTYLYPLAPFFSPFRINYHFEHHANFNVPWYLLPAYHERLKSIVPAEIWPYYFHHDFLRQLHGTKPRLTPELRALAFEAE